MTFELSNKVAIVTGAGSGIGSAIGQAFAQAGARVVAASRTLSKVQKVVDEIRAMGAEAIAVDVDVSQGEDVRRLVEVAMQQYGRIDILVQNAGISPAGTVTEISEEEWDTCVAIDLRSVFLGAKYTIPVMQKQGEGVLINIAGTLGIRPCRNKAAYSAAKAGAINLTRAIALDYARDRIRCNVICPGYIDTPLNAGFDVADRDRFLEQYQPLPDLIMAEEVAAMAKYLASDAAKSVTGQLFVIDGGQQAGIF
jgi:3-oxoacyl-[acyl-carrier protein] reductase